jgi:dihydroorotate dehydrogenase electron transfer subunit
MIQERCRVIRLERLSADTRRLVLSAPQVAAEARPGQFVMLGSSPDYDPLLRRPFSVHDTDGHELVLYFRVVGKGTAWLSAARPGDELSLLGPLGKGFRLVSASAILVGGGGIAPLLLLAKELAGQNNQAAAIILASRTASELTPLEESFSPWTKNLLFATDDGSLGFTGRADEALSSLPPAPETAVYACGPPLMLAAIARFCQSKKIACQVSVESAMACGMGACLGCAMPAVNGGYVHVCADGPVFDAEALPWA